MAAQGVIFSTVMESAITIFQENKKLADRAVTQLPDETLHRSLDENTNSVAIIMKHIAGNLLSRWTDFLTTDGEKTWRNRDDEFVDSFALVPEDAAQTPYTYWTDELERNQTKQRLDYCFISTDLADRVLHAHTDIKAEGSDHFPYWVEMDL